jgi:two-component system sensor histidine kinase BaeS
MRAAVESLQDGVAPDPQRYFGILGSQLDNIEGLLDQLVEYARIESGQNDRVRTTVSIAELAHEAVEAMSPVAHRMDVDVQLESDGPAVVVASTTDMSRVLRNLLENAIRHSPSGQAVHVAVQSGPEIEVRVQDQGPGFPDDFRDRAFEPFTRADPARDTRTGHSGLGLAIARALVEAHGGRIWLAQGTGADVRFSIPRKEPA